MNVKLVDTGIIVEPETAFGEQWLRVHYGAHLERKITAFLKHGMSADELVGLKVVMPSAGEPELF